MSRLEIILFILGTAFQVAAMVFAARMMGKDTDRRPWIPLFAALLLMLTFRVMRVMLTGSTSALAPDQSQVSWAPRFLSLAGTLVPLGSSFLIFISLLSIRRLALAERESKAAAAHRAVERDAAEEEARASIQKLKLVSDALPALIAYVDRDQRYQFNNRAYESWLCEPREYFLGKRLVVDDEPDARELIGKLLRDHDADVITAASTAEAMAMLKQQRPTVLISDIGMPHQDGYELMRSIRALPAQDGGEIPAVALTAFARSEDRTRAMLAGYQAHIAKPFEPRELVATLASLAGRTGRPAART